MPAKVKICGITNLDDAEMCRELGADFIGLIFAESPRRVELDVAARIARRLSGKVPVVGVFDRYVRENVANVLSKVKLDYLQVYYHPNNGQILAPSLPLFSSVWMDGESIKLPPYPCQYLLLDFKKLGSIDGLSEEMWESVNNRFSVFLAGGIDSDNVAGIVEFYNPYGVDTARGTESGPGVKDRDKVEKLIQKAKAC